MTTGQSIDVDDLCFTARALAQTHPMTEMAHRHRQARFEAERSRQPVTEIADWSATALLVGYCLRRAEEQAGQFVVDFAELDEFTLSERATQLAGELRDGDAQTVTLLASDLMIGALDRIISTEVHKRNEHVRDQLDELAWAEFEDYIAWWVVHGYCVRASEAEPR